MTLSVMHVEGCTTLHKTCVEEPPDALSAEEACHVFEYNFDFTLGADMDDGQPKPAGYAVWMYCKCGCALAVLGEVIRNGKVTPACWQSRSAAQAWADRRFPSKELFHVFAHPKLEAVPMQDDPYTHFRGPESEVALCGSKSKNFTIERLFIDVILKAGIGRTPCPECRRKLCTP